MEEERERGISRRLNRCEKRVNQRRINWFLPRGAFAVVPLGSVFFLARDEKFPDVSLLLLLRLG